MMVRPELDGMGNFTLPTSLLLILLPLCMNLVLLSVLSLPYLQRFQEKTHKILSAVQWSVYLLISVLISVFQMNAAQLQMLLLLSMVSTWLFGAVLYQRTERVHSFLPGMLSILPPAVSIFLHHLNIMGWDGVLTLMFIPMLHLSVLALRTQEPSSWVDFTEFTQQLSTPVIITNAEQQVKFINPAALSLQVSPSGVFTIDHLPGLQHQEMVHASRSETIFEVSLEGNLHYRVQQRPLPGTLTCYTLQQVRKKPSITEDTWKREQVARHLDEWTGTPNFLAFSDHLHTLALKAEHTAKLRTWVCWVDIDSSATVLAMLGTQQAMQGILHFTRLVERFSKQGIFRIDRDRIAFLLQGSQEHVAQTCEDIRKNIELEARKVFDQPLRLTATVVAMRLRKHNTNVDELLAVMEHKMREAQRNGGNTVVMLTDSQGLVPKTSEKDIFFAIQKAIQGTIQVHHQPIYQTQSRQVAFYEALLRIHDGESWQPPRYFAKVATQHQLWEALDWKVIDQVFTHVQRTGHLVYVNLNPTTISHPKFVESWTEKLHAAGLETQQVGIEILERTQFTDRLKNTLQKLHRLGVPIALDDFGSGTLNLQHIAELPLKHVKIDRRVLDTVLRDPHRIQVLRSLLELCRSYGHPVVLEGVCNELAMAIALSEGCEWVQGYLFNEVEVIPTKVAM